MATTYRDKLEQIAAELPEQGHGTRTTRPYKDFSQTQLMLHRALCFPLLIHAHLGGTTST